MKKSESIKNLAVALAKFQKEVKNPVNTAVNPYFNSKYAPLNDILTDIRPLLSKHGLSVIQSPGGDGNLISITTLLMHESGEWIEFDPLVLKADKATAQGAGSAITYGRRYTLSAILGISSEDDDDGNYASHDNGNKPTTPQPKNSPKPISKAQLGKINILCGQRQITEELGKELLKERYNKQSCKELTSEEASDFISYLEAS